MFSYGFLTRIVALKFRQNLCDNLVSYEGKNYINLAFIYRLYVTEATINAVSLGKRR